MSLPTSTARYPSYQPRHPDISSNLPLSGHGLLHHPHVDDHEQGAIVPMHGHYYHFYSSKDSLIQPEYPEDNRYPTSASYGLDSSLGSASLFFATPPHPHSYPSGPQHHVDYDSTPQLPTMPSISQHTEPSLIQPSQPYESQDQSAYASSGEHFVKKRALQACESCRQLRAKCDESRPCKTCTNRGLECIYREPPPKIDAQLQILEGIISMQSQLSTLTERCKEMDARLTRVESSKMPEDEVETEPGPTAPIGGPAIPTNNTTPFAKSCRRITPNEKA